MRYFIKTEPETSQGSTSVLDDPPNPHLPPQQVTGNHSETGL